MDWNAIKTEYITTSISYRGLAEKYGVQLRTIAERAKREKWVDARTQHNNRIVSKSVKKAEEKVIDYKSTLYALAYKVANQLNDMTDKHTIEELVAIGLKPKDITGAIKELGDALHLKSASDLKEQEARIAKLRKEAEKNDEDGNGQFGVFILPPIEGGNE